MFERRKEKELGLDSSLSLSEVKPLTSEVVCGAELGSPGRTGLVSNEHPPFTEL